MAKNKPPVKKKTQAKKKPVKKKTEKKKMPGSSGLGIGGPKPKRKRAC